MMKLSLLTAVFTATESLPASTWPRQPILPRGSWPRLQKRAERVLRLHREHRRQKHHHSLLARGEALELGSPDAPLQASSWSVLLAPLAQASAGCIRLISRADAQLETLPETLSTLLEVDQHHALQIDLVLDHEDLTDFDRPAWTLIRSLSDHGIAVRIGLRHIQDASDQDYHLHVLFEKAMEHGAFDLFAIDERSNTSTPNSGRSKTSWSEAFEGLRLQYACPQHRVGRG